MTSVWFPVRLILALVAWNAVAVAASTTTTSSPTRGQQHYCRVLHRKPSPDAMQEKAKKGSSSVSPTAALDGLECVDYVDFHTVFDLTIVGTTRVPVHGIYLEYQTDWIVRGDTDSSSSPTTSTSHHRLTVPRPSDLVLVTEDQVLATTASSSQPQTNRRPNYFERRTLRLRRSLR